MKTRRSGPDTARSKWHLVAPDGLGRYRAGSLLCSVTVTGPESESEEPTCPKCIQARADLSDAVRALYR